MKLIIFFHYEGLFYGEDQGWERLEMKVGPQFGTSSHAALSLGSDPAPGLVLNHLLPFCIFSFDFSAAHPAFVLRVTVGIFILAPSLSLWRTPPSAVDELI